MSLTTMGQSDDMHKIKVKDCFADCANGSINLGIVKSSVACCNTDRCNVQDAPDPSNVPNGKTCYSCDGKSCLNILSCSGSQDRCLKAAGHSFNCYSCVSLMGSCTTKKVKTCPSGLSKCVSLTTTTEAGSIKAKDCAVDCASGSMNVGTAKNSLVCCNTDKCNTQDAPDPANVPNGKTCYSCDGQSCSNILSCSGSEDLCFNGTANIGGPVKSSKRLYLQIYL
ncbi:urokinase plasminogen activator surface receptor-like [Labeo rohita]|uniref:urokinase plasminogen activator surface receptor-like n=1 Tax=Labeo rohita TaxID=84645 RepID=UPI0021E29A39|nr:urokinase plasminogen activator surface receptor-like [Labeo rohita]